MKRTKVIKEMIDYLDSVKLYKIDAETLRDKAIAAYCFMQMDEAVKPEVDILTGKMLKNPIKDAVVKDYPETFHFESGATIDEIFKALKNGEPIIMGTAGRFSFMLLEDMDCFAVNFFDKTIDVDDFFERFFDLRSLFE